MKIFKKLKSDEALLKKMPKQAVCAEIGVWKGDFSEKILRITKPKQLYLIDPWQSVAEDTYELARYGEKKSGQKDMDAVYHSVKERFSSEAAAGVVTIYRKPSEDVCHEFPDEFFDWVYIDGNHLYEFVKQDLEGFYPKVKRGGFIAGDDYREEGWWHDGVTKAVDEFARAGIVKTVAILQHQFILQKQYL